MKKIFTLILALLLIVAFVICPLLGKAKNLVADYIEEKDKQ